MGGLSFSVLGVPYLACTIALAVLAIAAIAIRGDTVLRLAVLVLCAAAIPWTVTFMLVGFTDDPELARQLFHVGYGGVSLVGPGLLMLVLGTTGRFDAHRALLLVAFASAIASAIICWSTDWVVRGVHATPSGFLYSTPGWYQMPHVGQVALWGVLGMLISSRGMRFVKDDERWRAHRRRNVWVIALAIITLSDSLLAHGIVGYYPIAWAAILMATAIALYGVTRADMFKGRGVDQPAIIELVAMLGVLAFLVIATWGGNPAWMTRPAVTAVFLAPLPMLGLVAAWTMRIRRRRAERHGDAASAAIEKFADEVRDLAGEAAIAERLGEVLREHTPVDDVRIWLVDEQGATRPLLSADGASPRIDARVRAWLVANAEPIVVAELTSARLGGLRSLIEDAVHRLAGDVVVPLVDRDAVVGIAVASLPPYRVLRDDERDLVRGAANAAARGLTFMSLTREADHLASTAREVELAEAVAQARATGDIVVRAGGWQLLGHYRPAARVAGDVWSCAELGEGRVMLFVGDVVGRGVPSALVSSAVGGVCDAVPALRGAALDPEELLELIHQTVRELGEGNQRVTGFAAILDEPAQQIRWACAGHRGAYLVHPPAADGDGRARLEILGGRSTPLGEPQPMIVGGEHALAPDDHLVAASDGCVEIRNSRGEPWGERRLQRMLRDHLIEAGDRAARAIVQAAVAHTGDVAIGDDMLVVVVRPA